MLHALFAIGQTPINPFPGSRRRLRRCSSFPSGRTGCIRKPSVFPADALIQSVEIFKACVRGGRSTFASFPQGNGTGRVSPSKVPKRRITSSIRLTLSGKGVLSFQAWTNSEVSSAHHRKERRLMARSGHKAKGRRQPSADSVAKLFWITEDKVSRL